MQIRKYYILFVIIVNSMNLTAQHVSSARGIGLAGHTASVQDVSALDWNPAGLIFIRDWELRISSFFELGHFQSGPFFNEGTIGKRVSDRHTFAFRYAPGLTRQFRVATDELSPTGTDYNRELLRQQLEYRQLYSFGYAHLSSPSLAFGIGGRLIEQQFVDPRIIVNDSLYIEERVYNAPMWSFDAGILYQWKRNITFGLAARNLIVVREDKFPEEFTDFSLNSRRYLRLGVSYRPFPQYHLAADFDTRSRVQIGHEFKLWDYVTVRQGNFINFETEKPIEAISSGLGMQFGTIDVDLSYLYFFDQSTRGRSTLISKLTENPIEDIGYNQFTNNRLDVTVRFQLGNLYRSLARIEYVELLSDVYPSSYQVHAFRPLARVRVTNISQRPIESQVGFFVKGVMDKPTETRPYYIHPGETIDVPVTAHFNESIRNIKQMSLRSAEIYVRATPTTHYDDRRQMQLLIHGRNDWNGDITTLRYFVTPEDPQILRFTRETLRRHQDELQEVSSSLEKFSKTRMLFESFASLLIYVSDPRKTHNRVQYPSETLDLRSGDCDDLSVAVASMLGSVGIASAFVDVVPPEEPHNAHVYLLIDTGLSPQQAHLISSNPKRYVIRKNEFGNETVWIPLEATAIQEGFDKAWEIGAESYYQEGIIKGGIIDGWVRIVDIPRS